MPKALNSQISPVNGLAKEKSQQVLATWQSIEKKGLNPQGFCLVPFTNLILEPGGHVGVCRQKGTEFTVGHLDTNTIEEIWNNSTMQKWRQEFLEGNPQICATEMKYKKCHLCPENNQLLPFVELNPIQKKLPIKLTANLNGFCNLECKMCDVWELPNRYYDSTTFWEEGEKKIFPFIKEIDFLSGEPFLQKDTYKLIKKISHLNPHCKWSFTTNLHWILTSTIKQHLDKIHLKNLIISIDGVQKKTYESIRLKGKFSFVLKNIQRMIEYNKERTNLKHGPFNIHMNFLVQKDNWKEVFQALDFCKDHNISPFLTFLYRPFELSLLHFSLKEKKEVLDTWFKHIHSHNIMFVKRVLSPLIDSLPKYEKGFYLLEIKNLLS